MLIYVADYLRELYSGFNVFSYLTTRAILGALTALVLSFAFGPYLIQRLTMQRIGQQIRQVGPESHFPKAGTPTMGGALILLAIAVSTLLWADLENRFVLLVLGLSLRSAPRPRLGHDATQVCDARADRRELLEAGFGALGDDAREGGFAAARRAPEDDRG